MVDSLRREMGLDASADMPTVVAEACAQLGIDRDAGTLHEMAHRCWVATGAQTLAA